MRILNERIESGMKNVFMIFCLFIYARIALAWFGQIIRIIAMKKKKKVLQTYIMMYRYMRVIWPVTLIVCLLILLFSKNGNGGYR